MDTDDHLDFGSLLPHLHALGASASGPYCLRCYTRQEGRIVALHTLGGVSRWLADILGYDAIVVCRVCGAVTVLPLMRLFLSDDTDERRN